jgi:hypothetical protein
MKRNDVPFHRSRCLTPPFALGNNNQPMMATRKDTTDDGKVSKGGGGGGRCLSGGGQRERGKKGGGWDRGGASNGARRLTMGCPINCVVPSPLNLTINNQVTWAVGGRGGHDGRR